jgi:prepilin-type N-terminal cleavage/methylation domain-containing protein
MRSRGFTLIELALVLTIIALMGGVIASAMFSFINTQRAVTTRAKLAAIDAALVSFVAVNRRLPCPANGQLNTGTEMSPCQNQFGVVPWVALGLAAQDIEDGWNNRISYRIDTRLGEPNRMDMSNCDPAGTGPPPAPPDNTCTAISGICSATAIANCVRPQLFLTGKGLVIKDAIDGTILMNPGADPATGAAYVIFSHGENQAGAFSAGGVMTSAIGITGTIEAHNSADPPPTTYYVDTPQIFSETASRFDDFVLRPSVLTVIQRAHLGPRSH